MFCFTVLLHRTLPIVLLSLAFALAGDEAAQTAVDNAEPQKQFDAVPPVLANAPPAPRAVLVTQQQQEENTAGDGQSARGEQPSPLVPFRPGQFVLPRGVNSARGVPFRAPWNIAGGAAANRGGRGVVIGPDGSLIRPETAAVALLTGRAGTGGFFRQPILGARVEGGHKANERRRGEEKRKEWRNNVKNGGEEKKRELEIGKAEEEGRKEWKNNGKEGDERKEEEEKSKREMEKSGKVEEERRKELLKNSGKEGEEKSKKELEKNGTEEEEGKKEWKNSGRGAEEEESIIEEGQKVVAKDGKKEEWTNKKESAAGGGGQLVVRVSGGKVLLDRNSEGSPKGERVPKSSFCEDRAQNCAENNDFCADAQYQGLMAVNCAKTCKLCPQDIKSRLRVPPGLKFPAGKAPEGVDDGTEEPSSWKCRDLSARCQFWTQRGFCASRLFHRDLKQRFCARSCGLCKPSEDGTRKAAPEAEASSSEEGEQ